MSCSHQSRNSSHDSKESGSFCGKTLKLKMTTNIYLVTILNELIQLTMTLIYKSAANSDNVYDLEWKWDYYIDDKSNKIDTKLDKSARIEIESYILIIKTYDETKLIEIFKSDSKPNQDPKSNLDLDPSSNSESNPESSYPNKTIIIFQDYDDTSTATESNYTITSICVIILFRKKKKKNKVKIESLI